MTAAALSAGFVVGMFAAVAVLGWLFHDYTPERAPSQGWPTDTAKD